MSTPLNRQRMTAVMDGEFCVFLIGMRINKPFKVHKWIPVALAMTRMLRELRSQPELGFLGGEGWFGRTFIIVQYWRSLDQLMDYATNQQRQHLPAWKAFTKAIGGSGDVGIWHETYLASQGTYENIYHNMPAFGLGRVGTLIPAKGHHHSAAGRMRPNNPNE